MRSNVKTLGFSVETEEKRNHILDLGFRNAMASDAAQENETRYIKQTNPKKFCDFEFSIRIPENREYAKQVKQSNCREIPLRSVIRR